MTKLRLHILDPQTRVNDTPVLFRLEHGKNVAVYLRLISDKGSRGMQNTRINLPAFARHQPVSAGIGEDAVVSLVPLFQTSPDIGLRGARFEPHVSVWKVVFDLVVLRWKVVCLWLALLPYKLRKFVALVHVVRNRTQVVEELAKQVPSLFALHHNGAEQQITRRLDGILQEKFLALVRLNVA